MGAKVTPRSVPTQPKAASVPGVWPQRLVVWCGPSIESVDRAAVERDLGQAAPALPPPEWRGDLLVGAAGVAAKVAGARVRDPKVREEYYALTAADLEIERAVDDRPSLISDAYLAQRLYDAHLVAKEALAGVPPQERSLDVLPVWVTRRLLVTYSQDDFRYHARYAVFAYPVMVSLLGLVHGPAPSLEATIFARKLGLEGMASEQISQEIGRQYPEERIDLADRGLVAHVVTSSILQAAARSASGEAFCKEPDCRLFNPHRRAEVRRSMGGDRFCLRHRSMFKKGARPP